jgi:hypothetical protein
MWRELSMLKVLHQERTIIQLKEKLRLQTGSSQLIITAACFASTIIINQSTLRLSLCSDLPLAIAVAIALSDILSLAPSCSA